MNHLIQISQTNINNELTQTVNARELHTFLGVGKDFSNWIKDQVTRARLVENRDFVKVAEKGELSKTGQVKVEYYLTIDAGKSIGMMSATDKGFEIRDYFLECERVAKQALTPQLPQTHAEALRALADQLETTERLQLVNQQQSAQILEFKPKAEFFDKVAGSKDLKDWRTVAATINYPHMGRTNLCAFLREKRVLMWDNTPYRTYLEQGYFKVTESEFTDTFGATRISSKTMVYQKGLDFIIRLLDKEGHGLKKAA